MSVSSTANREGAGSGEAPAAFVCSSGHALGAAAGFAALAYLDFLAPVEPEGQGGVKIYCSW